ncbi:hypothetical protein CSOJ01_03561 [Colletotrichum sojae]|uniref:Uncharacterized protein n=1 Tax=Colletotrichum sojae TaxID=2175907 RepID=A0A8H6N0P9_9PEZI|nr:hypothetical protein CSOJ01_03561 [Colletotrichum sojae]
MNKVEGYLQRRQQRHALVMAQPEDNVREYADANANDNTDSETTDGTEYSNGLNKTSSLRRCMGKGKNGVEARRQRG